MTILNVKPFLLQRMSMESFFVFRELAFSKHILFNRYKMMMILMSISIAHGFIDLNAQCVEGNFYQRKTK